MSVTLTAEQMRLLRPELLGRRSLPVLEALLAQASSQVALWVTESGANPDRKRDFSPHDENTLALLEVEIALVEDGMGAASEREEHYEEGSPAGLPQATTRKHKRQSPQQAYDRLLKKRKGLLAVLGVEDPSEYQLPPATPRSTIRGENDAQPGINWQLRWNRDPKTLRRR